MKVITTVFALLLGIQIVHADDIALTDGTILRNAKVVQQDDSTKTVTISFSGGIAQVRSSMVPAKVSATQQPPVSNSLPEPPAFSSPSNQGPENWSVAGRDYINVKVTQVEPDRVHITYNGGLGTVMLSDLSPELQKRFNYDPVAANQATQERTKQTAQADAALTAEMQQNAKADSLHPPAEEMAKHPCYMKGVVLQKISGGLLVQCDPVTVQADNGDSVPITYALPPNLPPGTKQVFGKFLLTNYPNQDSMVDGDAVTTVAYRTGAFSYTTTQGSNATVASYTAVLPGN